MICIHDDDDDDDDALKNGSVGRFFFLTERSDPIRTSWIFMASETSERPVREHSFASVDFFSFFLQ